MRIMNFKEEKVFLIDESLRQIQTLFLYVVNHGWLNSNLEKVFQNNQLANLYYANQKTLYHENKNKFLANMTFFYLMYFKIFDGAFKFWDGNKKFTYRINKQNKILETVYYQNVLFLLIRNIKITYVFNETYLFQIYYDLSEMFKSHKIFTIAKEVKLSKEQSDEDKLIGIIKEAIDFVYDEMKMVEVYFDNKEVSKDEFVVFPNHQLTKWHSFEY